ncbi:acetylglutamate kinase [Intestinimonas butyriciproducens]|uniref:acetylglutamate kinase n=3 Tax=Intestinimonas butyriciproducens TaxID=1297617 RepID=UPI001AB057C7|nr:acetylglutamate kinase [Intestinimonas butyriciproducens]MBO3282213.1 acetylglutamate kinase [Intestinimonas butyriciproducens]
MMVLPIRPLGDYWQLLQKHGLLSSDKPLPAELLSRPVHLVSCDSQAVEPGTLFIVKGAHFRGRYLAEALEKGAFVYLSDHVWEEAGAAPCLLVRDVRRAMALLADFYYDHPSGKLSVVGITGTKGKSSTTYYLKYIFDEYLSARKKRPSGVISSIDTFDGVERFESHLTTPEPLDLERHFANAVSSGLEYLTMEVSSQALKYDRMDGVDLSAAVFLNIGYDHISPIEHPDFEDYFASKLKIFAHSDLAVVNLDADEVPRVLNAARRHCSRVLTFSEQDPAAAVFGSQVRKQGHDILFRVKTPRFSREFRLTMPGLFNVQNALAAIAVCEGLGIPEQCIYVGLMKARVPGRMEVYQNANGRITAIVDYAHNRLSFEKLFLSVKEEYPGRRVVIVFGCPGKKALDRRKDLSEIAARYADLVVITEEDPGEEDVLDISREMAAHVENVGCDYSIEPDRGEAIRMAVMGSETPTVILITGKGAETRQKRGPAYIDCVSDVEYTKRYLHEYDVSHHLDGMEKVLGLLDTLPRLAESAGRTVVLKYGGSALGENGAVDSILRDVAALQMAGVHVVLVHGGGRSITGWLSRMGEETVFRDGYRVTDDTAMDVAEMVLSGQVNKQVVLALRKLGVKAAGVSGKDGGILKARCKDPALGHVGEIVSADAALIRTLLTGGYVPVISPVAAGERWESYNCNADDAACAVAEALKADKLVFLTDVDGILMDSRNAKTAISSLTASEARELLDSGLIQGGMVPKLRSCVRALENGVSKVAVLDGRIDHVMLLDAVSGQTMGTTLRRDEA